MEYLEFETDFTNFLKQQGWIISYTCNRQDSYIVWSELGKSKHKVFLNEIKKMYNLNRTTNKLLHSFCIYHGIIEPSKRESIISIIKGRTVLNGRFMAIISSKKGDKVSKTFNSIEGDDFYSFIEPAYDNEDEIVLIEVSDLDNPSAHKWTPFGDTVYAQNTAGNSG